MKVAVLVLALIALALAVRTEEKEGNQAKHAFRHWVGKHQKKYESDDEYNRRFAIFQDNLKFIQSHDAKAKGFSVALNKFADMTGEEFKAFFNGLSVKVETPKEVETVDTSSLAATVDWRTKGAVTKVKNQQQCGSCWSFSTTGSVEGAHFLKTGKLVSLSEQNLVDCSVPEGNQGCNGGLMDDAFQYIIDNKGIDTEASYPYTATGPNQCQYNPKNNAATISSFKDIPSGSESALQAAVATTPVSVAIDASQSSFQFYSSGVYYEPACSSTQLDHGVLAIGYGTESGSDYWLVKNSWGTDWGMAGYINMSRNRNNNCGIATAASYPIV